jgi:hypothetical protein
MNHRRTAAFLVATVVVVLAGCSSKADEAAPATATTVVSASAVAQIDAVCGDWKAQLDARGRLNVPGFDPENPDPALLPQVGAHFAAALPIGAAAIEQIKAIDAPPDEQADVDRLVAALEAQQANAQRQVDAATAADLNGFVPTLAATDALMQDIATASQALGTDRCAF